MSDILLMDDDQDFTTVLSEVLMDAGHKVTVCGSASAALEILADTKFDLLITDIIVRKQNRSVPDGGISLIGQLRAQTVGQGATSANSMPIIAISGAIHSQGMADVLKIARDLGADMAFGKPADIDEMLHAINTLTRN